MWSKFYWNYFNKKIKIGSIWPKNGLKQQHFFFFFLEWSIYEMWLLSLAVIEGTNPGLLNVIYFSYGVTDSSIKGFYLYRTCVCVQSCFSSSLSWSWYSHWEMSVQLWPAVHPTLLSCYCNTQTHYLISLWELTIWDSVYIFRHVFPTQRKLNKHFINSLHF